MDETRGPKSLFKTALTFASAFNAPIAMPWTQTHRAVGKLWGWGLGSPCLPPPVFGSQASLSPSPDRLGSVSSCEVEADMLIIPTAQDSAVTCPRPCSRDVVGSGF